jgi:dihydrofolate synthase / folylpolyglutamate synthase
VPNTPEDTRASNAPLETLADATGYLDGLINRERRANYAYARLDLKPIEALLDGLDHPERFLSVIHVAGSKGKGSTCLFAESILIDLGESVGTFTSPHLESWVERFRIDAEPIDDARLIAAVERVRPVVESLRTGPPETRPSFFDATTAVAFLLFADVGVDRALIEVGLGGRLDSTNVVRPDVTCITSIELEHTDKLGETEAEIAGEKAGILKAKVPVVLGSLRPEADRVIRQRAEEVAADVVGWGEAFRWVKSEAGLGGGTSSFTLVADGHPDIAPILATPGRVARLNAALAVMCIRALGVHSREETAEAALRALSTCRLPGRVEILAEDSRVLVDSAHTEESARALSDVIAELAPNGFDLLLSVSSDKDLERVLSPLLAGVGKVWVTRADPIRSLPAEVLAERVEKMLRSMDADINTDCGSQVECEPDPKPAARAARANLSAGRVLVVTGSVYLAGIARNVLNTKEVSVERV